jgi:pilus assembly protein Flp/PilA
MRVCVSFLPGSFGGRGAKNANIRRLMGHESGVTAIEYGLIAALIAIAAIVAMTSVGTSLTGIFTTVAGDL